VTGHFLESIALAAYTAVGPFAWIWGLVTIPMEQKRMRRDEMLRLPLPDPPPRLSVIIPAKDEEAGIRACVGSVLAQTYPNLSVIAVDHRSTDRTGAILDEMAAADARLNVVHFVGEIPAGWTGKNHAVSEGYAHADGDYLLFLDADCTLEPHTLGAVLAAAAHKRVDLVSIMPRLQTRNFWERVIAPFAGLISSMLDRGLREPYAFGWFLLFRRDSYERVGGHAAVKHVLDDDKQLALRIKEAGGRSRVWWGAEMAALTLNRSPSVIVHGLARNFFTMSKGRPWRLLFCLGFVLLCCVSAYAALAIGIVRWAEHPGNRHALEWVLAGAIHLAAMTAALMLIYKYGHTPRRTALALPLTLIMTIAIFVRGLWMCVTGNVTWHGVQYDAAAGK
jgi:chlorobactene glucosyltransferase